MSSSWGSSSVTLCWKHLREDWQSTFANPVFLGQANLLNLTRSIGLFGIFSVAMGIVIITGGIDLSIGSMFALLGVILAYLLGPV